ncbi:MAG: hypothetical protein LBT10_02540 [Methanobrevibacter sp.]|nr:hypothetical protein [Methanobrevibacter sp.]
MNDKNIEEEILETLKEIRNELKELNSVCFEIHKDLVNGDIKTWVMNY